MSSVHVRVICVYYRCDARWYAFMNIYILYVLCVIMLGYCVYDVASVCVCICGACVDYALGIVVCVMCICLFALLLMCVSVLVCVCDEVMCVR